MHIALAHVHVLQLNGSVALFFTGICHAHYFTAVWSTAVGVPLRCDLSPHC